MSKGGGGNQVYFDKNITPEPGMDPMMTNCGWEEIIAFSSPGEYHRFVKWIEEQAERGKCNEILGSSEVLAQWSDRRFQCNAN